MATRMHWPTLIVCPNMVKRFWADELTRWGGVAPERIAIYTQADRYDDYFFAQPGVDYYIVHWESLRLHKTKYAPVQWGAVIADEAHRMKNRNTQQSKIIRSIKARYKYALTGTPIVNRPDELWAILNFIDPKRFSSYWRFFEQHILAVPKPFGGFEVLGVRDPQGFKQMLQPYMLRRLKQTVLTQLPPKTYTKMYLDLLPKQRKAYEEMRQQFITELEDDTVVSAANALGQMVRLRQIASGLELLSDVECSVKLDAAEEFIADRNGAPLVVFTMFVGMAKSLFARLAKKGYAVELVYGAVAQEDRDAAVKRFQAGQAQIIILSIAVGGEGITLTHADTALFLEQSWSPAQQIQAEDRIHRISQQAQNVQIVVFETRDTVEQRVAAALKFKNALAQQVYTGKTLKELL